jgi:predicted RNA binding protein YcfA (HicA-like mRNA interferase family)
MTKREKALKRFRDNPQNVRFDEMHKMLLSLGFESKNSGSSHFVYRMKKVPSITIPHRIPFLLPIYVKQVLAIIDEFDLANQEEKE